MISPISHLVIFGVGGKEYFSEHGFFDQGLCMSRRWALSYVLARCTRVQFRSGHRRKFQDIRRRLRFGSFLSADSIIARGGYVRHGFLVLIIPVDEVELHHMKKWLSGVWTPNCRGTDGDNDNGDNHVLALCGGKSSILCQTKHLFSNSICTLWYMDCQKNQHGVKCECFLIHKVVHVLNYMMHRKWQR